MVLTFVAIVVSFPFKANCSILNIEITPTMEFRLSKFQVFFAEGPFQTAMGGWQEPKRAMRPEEVVSPLISMGYDTGHLRFELTTSWRPCHSTISTI
jgi:hypothetical protein